MKVTESRDRIVKRRAEKEEEKEEEEEEEEEEMVQAAEKTCVLNEYSMSSQAVKKPEPPLKGKRGEKIYSMNHEIIRVIHFSKFPDRYLLLSNRSFFSLSRQSHFVQL